MYEYSRIIGEAGHELFLMNLGTTSDSPKYYTFSVKIQSRSLQGEHAFNFCKDSILSIIEQLDKMHINLAGSVKIEDYIDAELVLEMIDSGHLLIHGQIGGTYTDNYLRFKFESDQTI